MRTHRKACAALLALLATALGSSAEVAYFDGASGRVHIPSVSVGAATYVDVTLQHLGNYVFALQAATEQVPPAGPGVASYDLATGVLSIPNVLVGCSNFGAVTLRNRGDFSFQLLTADLLAPPLAPTPAIVSQPANASLAAGQPANFSVQVSGAGPFSYQWRRNGVDIPGATGAGYTTPPLTAAETGAVYSVQVNHPGGVLASAPATVAVVTGPLGPGITSDPVGFTMASVGSQPMLNVLTSGFNPTFQWRRNGVAIPGATTRSVTLPALGQSDEESWYSVLMCNAAGCVTSLNAQVELNRPGTPQTVLLSAANNHSLAVRADGSVWGWGQSLGGTVSLAREATAVSNQGLPARAMCSRSLVFTQAVTLAGGYAHSLVVREDGTAWATGANGRGQLGTGDTTPVTALVPVLTAPGVLLQNVRAVATGTDTGHAVTADSQAWSWGNNQYQQLGDGTSTDRWFAGRVRTAAGGFLTGVTSVKAGTIHTLWLKADGSVWGAGTNNRGQLGDGTGLAQAFPVQAKTADGAALAGGTAISAGASHSLALLSDGSAMAWGYSNTGALANNGAASQQQAAAPVRDAAGQVLRNIVAVEAGEDTSYFLLSDGTLLGAGSVTIGTATSQPKPALVRDAAGKVLGNVRAISAHYRHALALLADGSVWGWGNNVSMNLADGTRVSRGVPVKVQGLSP
jgi:alpha-tubulin suppressor-like RCC1 family protein